jgi:hypothetical protein
LAALEDVLLALTETPQVKCERAHKEGEELDRTKRLDSVEKSDASSVGAAAARLVKEVSEGKDVLDYTQDRTNTDGTNTVNIEWCSHAAAGVAARNCVGCGRGPSTSTLSQRERR